MLHLPDHAIPSLLQLFAASWFRFPASIYSRQYRFRRRGLLSSLFPKFWYIIAFSRLLIFRFHQILFHWRHGFALLIFHWHASSSFNNWVFDSTSLFRRWFRFSFSPYDIAIHARFSLRFARAFYRFAAARFTIHWCSRQPFRSSEVDFEKPSAFISAADIQQCICSTILRFAFIEVITDIMMAMPTYSL